MTLFQRFGLIALLCLTSSWTLADEIPYRRDKQTAMLGSVPLDIYTYRPNGCTPTGLLIVFAGLDRNADTYRDLSRSLAQRLCLIVAAPKFDKERFPDWRYQHGGVIHHDVLQDRDQWTGSLVPKLIDWLRQQEAKPDMPVFLFGHSAGAQFLSRVAAYTPNSAQRMVVTNPSTYVLPSLDEPAPYGFRGLPNAENMLRAYLAAPVTIYLGEEDIGSENLATGEAAERQGATRFERGERAFHQAEQTAEEHGWPCNWRLVELPGVGHSAKKMLEADTAVEALIPPK